MSLSNCYIPLRTHKVSLGRQQPQTGDAKFFATRTNHSTTQTNANGKDNVRKLITRNDDDLKRDPNVLRRLCMDISGLTASDGSSIVEFGRTKVACAVHGPRSMTSSSLMVSAGVKAETSILTEGVLNCDVKFAPHFGVRLETFAVTMIAETVSGASGGRNPLQQQLDFIASEEAELSSRLRDALLSSVPLGRLVKTVLDVHVLVLQADGSILPASIVAASLALADAGVDLYDLVSCCSVAVVRRPLPMVKSNKEEGDRLDRSVASVKSSVGSLVCLVDPTEDETKAAEGVVTIAMQSNWKEVTFWDQTGVITSEASSIALDLCRDGCATLHKFMRNCLVTKETGREADEENECVGSS